jgi:hypothetical protein
MKRLVDRVLIVHPKEPSDGWQHAVNAKSKFNQNLLHELHLVLPGDENWLSRSSVRYHVQGEHSFESSMEVQLTIFTGSAAERRQND